MEFLKTVRMYWGSMGYFGILLLCVLAIIVSRKCGRYRRGILLYLALLVLLVWNPLAQSLWAKVLAGHLYWRMFWILPAVPLAAYALTGLAGRWNGWRAAALVLGCLLVLAVCGTNVYGNGNFRRADNRFKLPQEAVSAAAYMLERDGETKAIVPDTLACYIRQYTSRVRLLYGRDIYGYTAPVARKAFYRVHEEMESPQPNVKKILRYAKKFDCQYVVFDSGKFLAERPEKYGYAAETEVGGYTLYRREDRTEHE